MPVVTGGTPLDQLPAIDPATLATFYRQQLSWTPCAQGFQCATLRVPIDYAHPSGATIGLAVERHASTAADRLGAVVLNPGGPGASGLDYLQQAGGSVYEELKERFDVVSFDPRGVGKSAPIRCLTPSQEDAFLSLYADPTDPAAVAKEAAVSQQFANGCKAMSGGLLSHVGTVDTARDLDVLRAALGEQKLTYIGASYGTFLGSVYAELFPSHVRALVLDGALDPSVTYQGEAVEQANGFQLALHSFVADCLKKACPLGHSQAEARSKFDALLSGIGRSPLPTGQGGRVLTEGYAVTGIAAALYTPAAWPTLTVALAQALAGDGSGLLRLADLLNERNSNGTYSNLMESNVAINCADRPWPAGGIEADAQIAKSVLPTDGPFGAFIAWGVPPCAYWPVPPETRPAPIRAAGAPPILVLGTLRDPATPVAWARALASQLDSGVLVTWDGDGHTANLRGSACIDAIVRAYVVDLKVPAAGTTCPAV